MVDTSHQPALGYMEIVQRRDVATLLPIIQAHVAPGTIIHSDEWQAYRGVAALPSVAAHHTVNHSVTFVNPVNGAHTQPWYSSCIFYILRRAVHGGRVLTAYSTCSCYTTYAKLLCTIVAVLHKQGITLHCQNFLQLTV